MSKSKKYLTLHCKEIRRVKKYWFMGQILRLIYHKRRNDYDPYDIACYKVGYEDGVIDAYKILFDIPLIPSDNNEDNLENENAEV